MSQVKSGVRKMQKTEVVLNPVQAEFYETSKIYVAKRLQLGIRMKKANAETAELRKKVKVVKADFEKALDRKEWNRIPEIRKELKELRSQLREETKKAREKHGVGKYLKETNEAWRKMAKLVYQLPDKPAELPEQ